MNPDTFSQLQEQAHAWDRPEGLNMIDLLEMADPLRKLLNWIVRQDQVTIDQLSEYLQLDLKKSQELVKLMSEHNLLKEVEDGDNIWIRLQLIVRAHKPQTTRSIFDEL